MNSKVAVVGSLPLVFVAGCAQPIVCPTWTVYDEREGQCACDPDAGTRINEAGDACILPDGGAVSLPVPNGGRRDAGPRDTGAELDAGFDSGFDLGAADVGPGDLGPADTGSGDAGPLRLRVEEYLKASNTGAGDRFGLRVALSADGATLAVGAPNEASSARVIGGNQNDNSADGAGAVYVLRRIANVWTQEAYLKASNAEQGDSFGWSLSLSADGNTLAVGAFREGSSATGVGANQNDNTAPGAGAVYVFQRSGSFWAQRAYLKPSVVASEDGFGHSVALSSDGSTLAAGGAQTSGGSVGAGAVFLFRLSGNTWVQEGRIQASNPGMNDLFGFESIALDATGDTLAVAAAEEDSGAVGVSGTQSDETSPNSGAVYVFRRAGGVWSQTAYIKASNTGAGDGFGSAVAVSADGAALIVGASLEDSAARGVDGNQGDNSALDSGAVYVFSSVQGTWSQEAYIKAANADSEDRFGCSVALARNGTLLAIGALLESSSSAGVDGDPSNNDAPGSGAAYVFRRGRSGWLQESYVKASNPDLGDAFGSTLAVSLDGTQFAVGASSEASSASGVGANPNDNAARNAGAAYTYRY